MARVIMFLTDRFETVEALTPLDVLRRAGAEVVTVSITGRLEVVSAQKVEVKADMLLEHLVDKEADAYILPGGPGHVSMIGNEAIADIVSAADAKKKVIAAICAAPAVLGNIGVLNGHKATVFPGFESQLYGADVVDEKVVMSGHVITAKGMGVSLQFGLAIVSALYGKEKADSIGQAVQM